MYVYIYMYIRIDSYIHIAIYVCVYTCMQCMHVCNYVFIYNVLYAIASYVATAIFVLQKFSQTNSQQLVAQPLHIHPSCTYISHIHVNIIQPEIEKEVIRERSSNSVMPFIAEYGPIKLDNYDVSG